MRTIRFVLMMAFMLIAAVSVNAEKKGEKTVIFNANLHCKSCVAKVEKNIPFEKGVKGLKVDMETQTITITFREDKNNEENLKKAIEKLDIQVKGTLDAIPEKKADSCCEGKKCGNK